MSASPTASPARSVRKDGWTAARQLDFLHALARTRSVTRAAAAAGMTREGAYRLRNRRDGTLFAAIWDLALAPAPAPAAKVHIERFSDGRLARLLGTHFRRKAGDFRSLGAVPEARAGK